ncbi:hypothetical protein V1477_010834 [Vespula maculifrons]|uniref:Uncharacterized protein n=1 Tax=Vespula maculifrons TaxID=7453 RepID=A0ABD2C356_VESMC
MGSVADRLGPVAVSENMAAKFVQAKGKERRGELGAGRNRQNCDKKNTEETTCIAMGLAPGID